MIRLQLLPDYVFERERIIKAVIVCSVLLLIEVAITLSWLKDTQNKLADMGNQATAATANAGEVKKISDDIAAAKAAIDPYDKKREYITALRDFSDVWPKHMRMLSRYIYSRAEVLAATLTLQGFQLNVRTKTTEDVARLLMNLKQAYKAGLVAPGSLNIGGLTGWPNPTSPRGWGPDTRQRIEVPAGGGGGETSPVGSNTGPMSGAGPAAPAAPPPTPSAPGAPGAPPAAPPPPPTPAPGGSGGGMAAAGAPGLGADVAQFLASPMEMARRRYIAPSQDPAPQPYLNLSVTGNWATPIVIPSGVAAAAAPPGGAPGDPGAGGAPPPPVTESSGS